MFRSQSLTPSLRLELEVLSGHGCFIRNRTRCASTISTAATRDFSVVAPEPLYRSNENFTSSAHAIAVVEPDVLAQDELVREAVVRRRPRFGQARRPGVLRHGLHERVVERVEREERRDDARRLGGIEPRRCERDGGGERDLTLG